MLRIDLLHDLAQTGTTPQAAALSARTRRAVKPKTAVSDDSVDSGSDKRGGGPGRRTLALLLLALIVAGALYALMHPQEMKARGASILTYVTRLTDRDAHKQMSADSLRQAEALQVAASRRVLASQSQAIAWLRELETVTSDPIPGRPTAHGPPTYVFSLASFTPPQSFVLRGNARTLETLATLQEALVLFPGMELRQSESEVVDGPPGGLDFTFSGTVALEEDDSIAPANLVLPEDRLDAEMALLTQSAADLGIELAVPARGAVSVSGTPRIHTQRLTASCDSVGFAAISTLLEGERYRGSPFGIQRVTLFQKDKRKTVFLDIMAFSP